jgi:hypothetical protein
MLFSVPSQSNQSLAIYATSQTTGQSSSSSYDARSLTIEFAGAASGGWSNGSLLVSVAAGGQTNQTLGLYGISNTTGAGSTTTVDARSFSMEGAGAISVGGSNGSWIISAPGTVALTQLSVGISTGGNTVGTTGLATAQLVLAGGNNVTLSGSTNGGSMTITVSAGSGNTALTAYATGNTVANSSATLPLSSIMFNAIGGVTAAFSNGSIEISAPAISSLVGATGLTASIAGSTISIGEILQSRWDAWPMGQTTSQQQTDASASFRYIQLDSPVTFTRIDVPIVVSLATAATTATADINISSGLVVYSRNGSTLSPITGAFGTTTYTWASNSSNFSNLTGGKNVSFPINGSLSAGEYWVGLQLSTTNNSSIGLSTTLLGNTLSMILGNSFTGYQIGDFGSTYSVSQNVISQGMYTGTITATNQTIAMSNISATGTAGMAGNFPVIFRNY